MLSIFSFCCLSVKSSVVLSTNKTIILIAGRKPGPLTYIDSGVIILAGLACLSVVLLGVLFRGWGGVGVCRGMSESLPELGHRLLCNEGYAMRKVETSASESFRHEPPHPLPPV